MTTEDIVVHPRRGKREQAIPAAGILLVTPAEAAAAHAALADAGGKRRFLYNSVMTIAPGGGYFLAGPAVGSAMAAMTMEKLIALGAEKLIMYGWCGAISEALEVGDVVLAGRAVSGEGVSRYYPAQGKALPVEPLLDEMRGIVEGLGLGWQREVVWTTDAPYREDRNELARLVAEEGVGCVAMEYSALCSVAAFRGVAFGALLLVSDELHRREWKHGFRDPAFIERNSMLVKRLGKGF